MTTVAKLSAIDVFRVLGYVFAQSFLGKSNFFLGNVGDTNLFKAQGVYFAKFKQNNNHFLARHENENFLGSTRNNFKNTLKNSELDCRYN